MDIKTRFESIVERRIREAQEGGKFDNLPGHGKPLELEDDSNVPEDLRLAYKILKNADCVPKEIEANLEVKRMEDLISDMTDVTQKYKAMKKLNFLKQKILKTKRSAIFDIPETYEHKVVELVEKKPTS